MIEIMIFYYLHFQLIALFDYYSHSDMHLSVVIIIEVVREEF